MREYTWLKYSCSSENIQNQIRKTSCYSMISSKENVPGASLGGRDPGSLKVPELKRWLDCRNASTRGKKADLVLR